MSKRMAFGGGSGGGWRAIVADCRWIRVCYEGIMVCKEKCREGCGVGGRVEVGGGECFPGEPRHVGPTSQLIDINER